MAVVPICEDARIRERWVHEATGGQRAETGGDMTGAAGAPAATVATTVEARACVAGRVSIRLLGEFEVTVDGQSVHVPGRQRVVLAALALSPNQMVPVWRLLEYTWPDESPNDVRNALQSLIARLRRRLGPAFIETVGDGYLLRADAGTVDLLRFHELVAQADEAAGRGDRATELSRLREALRLWPAGPLQDVPSDRLRRHAAGLLDLRFAALERRLDLDFDEGRHRDVIAELRDLAERYPLRESLWRRLMLALYRAGRRAEALEAYQQIAGAVRSELGLDVGRELAELQREILSDGPRSADPPVSAASPAPRQLPADIPTFVGRAGDLSALDRLLELIAPATDARQGATVIAAIDGTAGIGKTVLAVHWALRVADRFPDGQLYVDLRGFDPGGAAVSPGDAVRGFLDAFGVPQERMPVGLDAQIALYRTLISGRRMLLVLDNARDADQVRPLLPGTPTCLVVVTSRTQLTPLVATVGAHPLTLGLLRAEEARELLARRLGRNRIVAEPEAVGEIIEACARLPLALSITAARAQQSGFSLATVAAELNEAARRLDALDAGDASTRVRSVISWSRTALSAPAARLFELVGSAPGTEISAAAAASLAGQPFTRTRGLLTELVRANLLREHVPGRYSCHDLLRAYATEAAPDDERAAALVRLADHYLHSAYAIERLLNPGRDAIPLPLAPPAPGTGPEWPAGQEEAVTWLATEQAVLPDVLRATADAGLASRTWQLTWSLDTYLDRQGHWEALVAAWQAAEWAADQLGDPALRAFAHRILGHAYTRQARYPDAERHLGRAHDLYVRAGQVAGQALTQHSLSLLWDRRGRPDRALKHARESLGLSRSLGSVKQEAYALNAVGWYLAQLGHHTEALMHCEQALALHRHRGDRHGEAATWDSLGYIHSQAGNYPPAVDSYRRAVALRSVLGDRYYHAETLASLGDTQQLAGDGNAARAAWQRALEIFVELDRPEASAVRAKLHRLTDPTDVAAVGAR